MPRPKKTSSQPKRKPKKPIIKPKPVYPEFVQNFINLVESTTPLKVRVDQYSVDSGYHVGVLKKEGTKSRCIWMVGYSTTPEELRMFWDSNAYKTWKEQST